MNLDDADFGESFGMRLDREAREMLARRLPRLQWLSQLQPVLGRVSDRAASSQARFERRESDIAPVSMGEPLPWHLKERVEQFSGPGAAAVRIHDGPAADEIAVTHNAEAVAAGANVFFRKGNFRPETPRGFGLLVHEASHVIEAMRPGAAWRRATATGRNQEEARAESVEAMSATRSEPGRFSAVAAPSRRQAGSGAEAPPAASVPASSYPMRAEAGRAVPQRAGEAQAPPLDVEKLRRDIQRDLQRDLLRQLRSDFEREHSPMAAGELGKARILNTDSGDIFPVMYNPEEFRLEQGNQFAEIGIPGLSSAPLQYVRGRARTLSMELFFDTYETGRDVRDYSQAVVRLLDKTQRTKAPPVLVFSMGQFNFRCVLADATQRFTMFLRNGTPARAILSARFQEFVRVDFQIQRGFFVGPPTLHNITQRETLPALAAQYLGDARRWREIAAANRITDPFHIIPGTPLVIPAGKKQ